MSLEKIMAEITRLRPLAETEVTEEPRSTLGGRLQRQKKAKEDLKSLSESYRQSLLTSAVFVLVIGKQKESFVEMATEKLNFFSADPDQFYNDIAAQISPSLYDGKESSPNVLDVVTRVLENKAMEVGITGYPLVTFKQEYRRVIKGRNEFQALIKQIISGQVGTEVVGAQAVKSILTKALDIGHKAKTTPILLTIKDEASLNLLADGLKRISRRVVIVQSGELELDERSVVNALASIKNEMQSNSSVLRHDVVLVTEEPTILGQVESSVLTEEMVEEAGNKAAKRNKNRK